LVASCGDPMKLIHVKQKLDLWMKRATRSSEAAQPTRQPDYSSYACSSSASVPQENFMQSDIAREPSDRRGATAKVIEWRRRVLVRKGARMQAAMLERSDGGSLAMLDVCGVVVYWGEGTPMGAPVDAQLSVLQHHVSQFYVPEDVACSLPLLHLRDAVAAGNSTQRGWRKRSDGTIFWATTVIEALSLRGGSLQGFSHVVRESKDPWVTQNSTPVRNLQQREAEALWQPRDGAYGSLVATGARS
jgi:hypothetical protein